MNDLNRIQCAIDFIEKNLKNDLSYVMIAKRAFFSQWHFQRVFHILVDETVGDYIRKRRLTSAAKDLIKSKSKIIEIAFDYGYDAPESFTRAFKNYFGITPSAFRKKEGSTLFFEKINIYEQIKIYERTGAMLEPKIVTKDEFMIVGAELRVKNQDGENFAEIPKFWSDFLNKNRFDEIPNVVKNNISYGICCDCDPDESTFSYIIAQEVSSLETIPEGMIGRVIPKAEYLVFTAKGSIPDDLQETIKQIYGTWLPNSKYRHAGTPDFELYDCHRMGEHSSEVDVYIPIKEK